MPVTGQKAMGNGCVLCDSSHITFYRDRKTRSGCQGISGDDQLVCTACLGQQQHSA